MLLYYVLTTGIAEVVGSWRQGSDTALTEAVFSTEGDTLPSREGLSETHRKRHRYSLQPAEKNPPPLNMFA